MCESLQCDSEIVTREIEGICVRSSGTPMKKFLFVLSFRYFPIRTIDPPISRFNLAKLKLEMHAACNALTSS